MSMTAVTCSARVTGHPCCYCGPLHLVNRAEERGTDKGGRQGAV